MDKGITGEGDIGNNVSRTLVLLTSKVYVADTVPIMIDYGHSDPPQFSDKLARSFGLPSRKALDIALRHHEETVTKRAMKATFNVLEGAHARRASHEMLQQLQSASKYIRIDTTQLWLPIPAVCTAGVPEGTKTDVNVTTVSWVGKSGKVKELLGVSVHVAHGSLGRYSWNRNAICLGKGYGLNSVLNYSCFLANITVPASENATEAVSTNQQLPWPTTAIRAGLSFLTRMVRTCGVIICCCARVLGCDQLRYGQRGSCIRRLQRRAMWSM